MRGHRWSPRQHANIKVASMFAGSSRSVMQWPPVRAPRWQGKPVGGAMTRSSRVPWVALPSQPRRQLQMRRGSRCLRPTGLGVHHNFASWHAARHLPACRPPWKNNWLLLPFFIVCRCCMQRSCTYVALPATLRPSHFPREVHVLAGQCGTLSDDVGVGSLPGLARSLPCAA